MTRIPAFWAGAVAVAVGIGPVWAETKPAPPPFKDFSAKRVGLPKPGQKRITVQIGVDDAVADRPSAEPEPEVAVRSARYEWFWEAVSPARTASGPERLQEAFRTLSLESGNVAAPRLQTLQDITKSHGADILRATVGTDVSPALALAVLVVESAGRADAVSRSGAQGLMQLMPATADRFGVRDAMQPSENIAGGVKYLNWLMDHFDGDPVLVLAGYNAGEGAVRDHDGVPPYPETRDYVPKVLAAYQVAKGLCLTPPELITDGCVFAGMR